VGLSLGKWRRLQQATTARGAFAVLAVDHRGPLRRALAPRVPEGQLNEALSSLKVDIVRALGPLGSAVLLDPETGLEPCLLGGALPGGTGLLVALDTGSTGDPAVLSTGLVADWSVEKTLRAGAAGAKLLVYYHPQAPNAAAVEQLVRDVGEACAQADLPFYLEPLGYAPGTPPKALPADQYRHVVIESARRLTPLGVDVLKAEFPLNILAEPDAAVWRAACAELTAVCPVPWVLLSAGVSYERFVRQAAIACEAGASGVMAGRAVWNEAVNLEGAARRDFLHGVARDRMWQLRSLCEGLARPWTERFPAPSGA